MSNSLPPPNAFPLSLEEIARRIVSLNRAVDAACDAEGDEALDDGDRTLQGWRADYLRAQVEAVQDVATFTPARTLADVMAATVLLAAIEEELHELGDAEVDAIKRQRDRFARLVGQVLAYLEREIGLDSEELGAGPSNCERWRITIADEQQAAA